MQSDEQEIRQLVATWMTATKAGNIETVLSLMAEDVVFLMPGRSPMIGKSAFAAAAGAQTGQERPQFDGTSEIQEIKVFGEWAFILHVDTAIGRRDSSRWCPADDACRPYAFHSKKAKRQMGAGARCEHVVARVEIRGVKRGSSRCKD